MRSRRIPTVAIIAAVLAASPAVAKDGYGEVAGWNTFESDIDELGDAEGLAIRGSNLYLAEGQRDFYSGDLGVRTYTLGGTYLERWGKRGEAGGDGEFLSPSGIAVDSAGNFYVSDRFHNRIQKFSPAGAFITAWGSKGKGPGQFERAEDVAVDAAGNVYVADSSNQRIQRFDSQGGFIRAWGGPGEGPYDYGYQGPGGVATDPAGNVYATDPVRGRVLKFTPNGDPITSWDSSNARHITADPAGNLFVVESIGRGIYKYGPDGEQLDLFGPVVGITASVGGIATDAAGDVYVAHGQIVQQFAPVPRRPAIKGGPAKRTRSRKAALVFRFADAAPGVRFQCRLTGQNVPAKLGRWRRCTSPKSYRGLRPGKKLFSVRGAKGQLKGKAAKRSWQVVDSQTN